MKPTNEEMIEFMESMRRGFCSVITGDVLDFNQEDAANCQAIIDHLNATQANNAGLVEVLEKNRHSDLDEVDDYYETKVTYLNDAIAALSTAPERERKIDHDIDYNEPLKKDEQPAPTSPGNEGLALADEIDEVKERSFRVPELSYEHLTEYKIKARETLTKASAELRKPDPMQHLKNGGQLVDNSGAIYTIKAGYRLETVSADGKEGFHNTQFDHFLAKYDELKPYTAPDLEPTRGK